MLDHTVHPTVVTEIIGHCSVPALAAFRATSRHFRDAIDGFLFEHATILWQLKDGEDDVLEPVLFTTPESRWGSTRLPWAPQRVKTLDLGWDTTTDKPAERVPLSTEPGRVLPESSRLVPEFKYAIGPQMVAAVRRNHFPPALADKFTNVSLVRRFARASSAEGTSMPTAAAAAKTTIVDFVCLSDWWDAAQQNLESDLDYDYLFQASLALPRQVDRHVLHIGWHEYRNQSDILHDLGIEHKKVDVRELVVVLRPSHDRGPERQVEELEGLTFISYSLLRYMIAAGKVTIVGADSLHPDQVVDDEWDGVFGNTPEGPEEGRRWADLGDGAVRRFNKYLAIKILGSMLPGSDLAQLRGKLTHLTMDEWLGELAHEGRALEGEWPGGECAATYDDYQRMYG
ncbi:uncharacterized protein LOC62_01G001482 [Vanrija pseudolonga]|uniref:F-box domain-containing protein n=1 Tax=Vanrija pseudolonga TaxID=143232 RepID=A0AAF0Y0R6_9TREE|nr:hypothetical protein LOC62_01G001482 [Vanrija pseudolonga]